MVATPSPCCPTPLLEVRGLTKRFGRHLVLDDVDLVVRPGELVALVGENGAGKSTLVQCVAGTICARRRRGAPRRRPVRRRRRVAGPRAVREPRRRRQPVPRARAAGGPWLSDAGHARRAPGRCSTSSAWRSTTCAGRPASCRAGSARRSPSPGRCSAGPRLLVLDEPTAALGVAETHMVERIVRELRASRVWRAPHLPPHRAGVPAGRPGRGAPPRPGGGQPGHGRAAPRRRRRPDGGDRRRHQRAAARSSGCAASSTSWPRRSPRRRSR